MVCSVRADRQCHSLFQVLNKTRANISMHFVIMDDSSYTFTSSGKYALPHMYINLLFVVLFRCSSIIMKCITMLLFSYCCRLVWMSIYVRMLHLTYAAARWVTYLYMFKEVCCYYLVSSTLYYFQWQNNFVFQKPFENITTVKYYNHYWQLLFKQI